MRRTRKAFAGMCLLLVCGLGVRSSVAQERGRQRAPQVVSPEVHEDGRVTLRVRAPKAGEVVVQSGELQRALGGSLPSMKKGENGVWSVTLGPVAPGIYDYYFVVDGLRITDPTSPHVFANRRGTRGYVDVPGPPDKPRHDQWRDVPHGAVTAHWYPSSTTGQRRRLHVYTPPGYHESRWRKYPVMFLLHGAGDNDSHWTKLGRAHVIMDNLIADGKAKPMVVVMPDGHVYVPQSSEDREVSRARRGEAFEKELINDIIPYIEARYRVRQGAMHRAIVGLSMGGGQSLGVGLKHVDEFAWVGGFSSAVFGGDAALEALVKDPRRVDRRLKLLWIAIGTDDFLLERNREFIAGLKKRNIDHEYHETDGAHMWSVWRRYLADFAPRLFR